MILHSVCAAPDSSAFEDCCRLLRKGDAILLMGDGVYSALGGTVACDRLLRSGASLYLLESDGAAAGILERTHREITVVNFDEFAALTEQFPKYLAWY